MDIAKYAGLFFLRSEYVYLPGLGNLEIKKSPASYSSETGSIAPANAQIIFKPTIGVIDDAFANFVANNERVSIASAANAIADFGKRVKSEVINGGKVEIPGIGHFTHNGTSVDFEVSAQYEYKPKSIPVFKNVSNTEEYQREKDIKEIFENTHFSQPKSVDEIELEKPKVNYAKLFTLIVVGIILLGGLGYLIYSIVNDNNNEPPAKEARSKEIDESALKANTPSVDTPKVEESTQSKIVDAGKVGIIVNEYKDTASANKRVAKLTSIGYDVKRQDTDSLIYVFIQIDPSDKGEQFLVDSMKKILNPRYNVRVVQ